MAMSAAEQIQLQVDRSLEPKLEVLLAKKIRPTALKSKPSKKEQHYKFSSQTSNTREHFAKKETRQREHSDNSEFILAKFAKRNVDEETSYKKESYSETASDQVYDSKPSGKGNYQPSGKGRYYKRGNCKPVFEPYYDCYGIDVAPMHVFENQVIPVRIHNASKKFKPNLHTIRVLSLGTKFIPKWKKTNTSHTFKWFNEFKNKLNKKFFTF